MSKQYLKIRNQTNEKEIDLDLYGEIGDDWFLTAEMVMKELEGLDPETVINVHINSMGGVVWEGVTIYNRLKSLPNRVNVYIEGLAASIASVVAMAGDTIHMCMGSMLMVHNAWTFTYGNADELRKEAERLDKVNTSLVDIYTEKTGRDRDEVIDLMKNETWLTASEAVEEGFADSMDEKMDIAACLRGDYLVVNGVGFDVNRLKGLPVAKYAREEESKGMDKTKVAAEMAVEQAKDVEAKQNVKKEMTVAKLQEQYPELMNEFAESIRAEATKAERERIHALDRIKKSGCEDIINKAKYETFMTAKDVALEILENLPEQPINAAIVKDMQQDSQVVNQVASGQQVPTDPVATSDKVDSALIQVVKKMYKKD